MVLPSGQVSSTVGLLALAAKQALVQSFATPLETLRLWWFSERPLSSFTHYTVAAAFIQDGQVNNQTLNATALRSGWGLVRGVYWQTISDYQMQLAKAKGQSGKVSLFVS